MLNDYDDDFYLGELPLLVTSDVEATWPIDKPIVFLGKWCLRYSRKDLWTNLHFTVAPYHWDDRTKIASDLQYIDTVYENLLPPLSQALNEIHGVNYSVRYWRIALGYWLMYFSQVYFDRWQTMHAVSNLCPGLQLFRLEESKTPPASADTSDFVTQMQTGIWNERLCAEIADEWTPILVQPLTALSSNVSSQNEALLGMRARRRYRVRATIRSAAMGVQRHFGRRWPLSNRGIALHVSYLRRLQQWKLELLLGQLPSLSFVTSLRPVPGDAAWRQWSLEVAEMDNFAKALAAQLPRYLPTCYLEGYAEATQAANASGWPREPRVIMTSNSFAFEEKWKLWAAERCELGAKLVVAQHGGFYGTGAWSTSQKYEISICDRFLSWGWSDPNESKVFPAPSVKFIGVRKRALLSQGICLQVTCAMEQQVGMVHSFPLASQLEEYLEEQLVFAARLSSAVREQLVVRLFRRDFGWEQAQRWSDSDPEVTTESGTRAIGKLLKRTKLYVATYNGTTFLESLKRDIPTVMFWNPKLWELSEGAVPHFDALRRASILFDDPASCADHVSRIWSDVPGWWESSVVQDAVSSFLYQYAYVGANPLRELKAALSVDKI